MAQVAYGPDVQPADATVASRASAGTSVRFGVPLTRRPALGESQFHHRLYPPIPDLIIAAMAESAGLVVLHDDKDFELNLRCSHARRQSRDRVGHVRRVDARQALRQP